MARHSGACSPLGCVLASGMCRRSHIRATREASHALRKDQCWLTVGDIGTELLLSEAFDHSRVTALRHSVMSCARAGGLGGDRLEDFVVAVNELMTNAVRHGGGAGRVTVWRAGRWVVCEVSDRGTGLSRPPVRPERPPRDTPGGWGLWLAGELTDEMTVTTGTEGTTVRLLSRVL